MSLLFLAYGMLALAAFLATKHDRELFWVGFWLVGGWAISNALDWYAPLEWQVSGYTGLEMCVATAAICALSGKRKAGLIAIIILALLSVGVNGAFAMIYSDEPRQVFVWKGTTNLIFAAECLLAFGVGITHGIRSRRIADWFRIRSRLAASRTRKSIR